MDKSVDLVSVFENHMQAVVPLATVVVAHVVGCVAAAEDGGLQVVDGIADFQGVADQLPTFLVQPGVGVIHDGLPILENVIDGSGLFLLAACPGFWIGFFWQRLTG